MNCEARGNQQKEWQRNEETKQKKSEPENNVKDNTHTNCIINQETGFFVAGQDMETERVASAKNNTINTQQIWE